MSFRNPMLELPATARLRALPPPSRAVLRAILRDLAKDARGKSDLSWRRHKGPISRLRSLGFVDYPNRGQLVAQPVLFLEGA